MIIPEAFVGLLPIEAGETIVLCMGKRNCKNPYKARIVGTVRRMPGLFDISGYAPMAFATPGCIITYDQSKLLIE